jgi:biopolymer transport protein ExbD
MKGTGELPLNMTPMIDVVFLLIIFFMIVIDLSQKELEEIVLPRASECEKDDPSAEKWRKIVNLRTDGTIVVSRVPMTLEALQSDLFRWRNSGLFQNEEGGFCAKPLLIRTDRGTEMKHAQKVMQICGVEQLKIYKIELACAQDSPGLHTYEDPTQAVHLPEEE